MVLNLFSSRGWRQLQLGQMASLHCRCWCNWSQCRCPRRVEQHSARSGCRSLRRSTRRGWGKINLFLCHCKLFENSFRQDNFLSQLCNKLTCTQILIYTVSMQLHEVLRSIKMKFIQSVMSEKFLSNAAMKERRVILGQMTGRRVSNNTFKVSYRHISLSVF